MHTNKGIAFLLVILIFLVGARFLRWEQTEEVSKGVDDYSFKVQYVTDRWTGQSWVRMYGFELGSNTTILGGTWRPIIDKTALLNPKTEAEKAAFNRAFLLKQILSISWIVVVSAIFLTLLVLAFGPPLTKKSKIVG